MRAFAKGFRGGADGRRVETPPLRVRPAPAAVALSLCAVVLLLLIPSLAAAHNPLCDGVRATIARGRADNVIRGTNHHDVIQAGIGNDIVIGRGGNDRICGGRSTTSATA